MLKLLKDFSLFEYFTIKNKWALLILLKNILSLLFFFYPYLEFLHF